MTQIHDALFQVDSTMNGLVERYGTMRLLRQDPRESLTSYACSQNNNIGRVAEMVNFLDDKHRSSLE